MSGEPLRSVLLDRVATWEEVLQAMAPSSDPLVEFWREKALLGSLSSQAEKILDPTKEHLDFFFQPGLAEESSPD